MSALTTATGVGVRKAAVLLIQMGRERAAAVLSHLTDTEVEAISGEIARLQTIDTAETEEEAGRIHDQMVRQHVTAMHFNGRAVSEGEIAHLMASAAGANAGNGPA